MKQSELALALGRSKGFVSKKVAAGMPLDSVEAARAWLATHSKEGTGAKAPDVSLTQVAQSLAQHPPPAPAPEGAADGDSLEARLWQCRESVRSIHALVTAAIKKADESKFSADYAVIPGLHRNYVQALSNLLELERKWDRHQLKSGQVAPTVHFYEVVQQRLGPLNSQLANFPRMIAAQANPADPALAERVITAGLIQLRTQIAAAQSEPVPPAPDISA